MIKVEYIFSKNPIHSCDNCNKEIQLVLMFSFLDKNSSKPYATFVLCENCSNAVVNLFRGAMKEGGILVYENDKIIKIGE